MGKIFVVVVVSKVRANLRLGLKGLRVHGIQTAKIGRVQLVERIANEIFFFVSLVLSSSLFVFFEEQRDGKRKGSSFFFLPAGNLKGFPDPITSSQLKQYFHSLLLYIKLYIVQLHCLPTGNKVVYLYR